MRYNRLYLDNDFLTPTTYTQDLSEYSENLKFDDLPEEVVERAKRIMVHCIGAAIASVGTEVHKKAFDAAVKANGGEGGPVTVWGTGTKLSAVNAGFLMGVMADALDWEDCSWTGHPSAGAVPDAWTAAEEKHRSGKEMLTAIVDAYEIYHRIAMSVQPNLERRQKNGWGLTSWQIFASLIPYAKLYGFDARKTNQAISMACECAPVPSDFHQLTMSDHYHYEHGYRNRDGAIIAKSVEAGINNCRDALDEPRCYLGTMCGDSAKNGSSLRTELEDKKEYDITWLTRDLGKRYFIMDTLLKHWPANMWVQTPLELLDILQKKYGFGPDDIESIVLDPPVKRRMWASPDGFESITHAQFSIPYVLSRRLLDPVPGAYWYTKDKMKDAKAAELSLKVKGGPSPEESPYDGFTLFQQGSYPMRTLTVTTKDGHTYTESMDCHPGHPANMMSREELSDRFRLQAKGILPDEKIEKALDALWNIEKAEDIAAVSDLLC
ncbi:MAG: MmgE/PrpD family protein [Lachnospiraceae bacterium]|nr:MmgE/PrpD family protein [Lachnospiraceae bacterium]